MVRFLHFAINSF